MLENTQDAGKISKGYSIRAYALILFLIALGFTVSYRLFVALQKWQAGYNTDIESFSFCVIFPVVLILVMVFMPPTKSQEGILMRLGKMIQLFLIIALPKFALYLALGLPVVFLVVEVFVTKLPQKISNPIQRIFIDD